MCVSVAVINLSVRWGATASSAPSPVGFGGSCTCALMARYLLPSRPWNVRPRPSAQLIGIPRVIERLWMGEIMTGEERTGEVPENGWADSARRRPFTRQLQVGRRGDKNGGSEGIQNGKKRGGVLPVPQINITLCVWLGERGQERKGNLTIVLPKTYSKAMFFLLLFFSLDYHAQPTTKEESLLKAHVAESSVWKSLMKANQAIQGKI